jgi:hypothetical protein
MFHDHTVVVATAEQVIGDLNDGHLVILNLRNGGYYGLNSVGGRILQLIQDPMTVGELQARLMTEYEVDADSCRSDLVALLEQLAAHQLIAIHNGLGA